MDTELTTPPSSSERLSGSAKIKDPDPFRGMVARVSYLRGQRDVLEKLRAAIDPFARAVRLNAPLRFSADRGLRDCLPGVWPTWGDLRALVELIEPVKHEWVGGMTPSTPEALPEGYCYCARCGLERTDTELDDAPCLPSNTDAQQNQ